MLVKPTLTLGLCLAAGVAFGIGLARPGDAFGGSPVVQSMDQVEVLQPTDGAYNSPSSQQPGAVSAPSANTVTISGFDFGSPLIVEPGAAITVTNVDGVSHTLTAEDGSFDSGVVAARSQRGFFAPDRPADYAFFCSIHPSMRGVVTVR